MSGATDLIGLNAGIDRIVKRLGAGQTCVPLIGAGVSGDAGIPQGADVVTLLKARFPGRLPLDNYEYAEAFKLVWPGPEDRFERRKFFESLCAGRRPGPQTYRLVHLIENGVFPIVLTTNFDHLIEYALIACSSKPKQIFVEEEAYFPIVAVPKCSTLLKIHGDFLFDDLAILDVESQYKLRASMRTKLIDGTIGADILVAGYRGCDKTVMTLLEERLLAAAAKGIKSNTWWLIFDPKKETANPLLARLVEIGEAHNQRVTLIGPTDAKTFFEEMAVRLKLPSQTIYPFGINPAFANPLTLYDVSYVRSAQALPTMQEASSTSKSPITNARLAKALHSRRPIWITGAFGSGKTQVLSNIRKALYDLPALYFNPKFSEWPLCPNFMTDLRIFAEQIGVNTLEVDYWRELYCALFERDSVVLIDDVVSGQFPIEPQDEWIKELGLLIEAYFRTTKGTLVFTSTLSLPRFVERVRSDVFCAMAPWLEEVLIKRDAEVEKRKIYLKEIESNVARGKRGAARAWTHKREAIA